MAAQTQVDLGNLGIATEEVSARFFAETFQAEPWVFEIGHGNGCDGRAFSSMVMVATSESDSGIGRLSGL